MKKITLFFLLATLISNIYAQAPHLFNYQGVARDVKGNPLVLQTLSVKIDILPSSESSDISYEELHVVQTNEFGLYALKIGNGTPVKGSMELVKWETGNQYIRVAIDPNGGTNYQVAGTTQLLSVPYALFAEKSGVAKEVQAAETHTTRAASNYIEKTSSTGVINSTSQIFDNGSGVAIGFANPIYTFESRRNGNTDWCIRNTNAAGTSRTAFRIQNEDSTLGQIDFTKFGKSYGGTFMGISRNNMAGINSLTGPFVLNCGGDMIFGNSLTVTPFTQSPRLTINGTSGNVGIGLPLGGIAAAKLEVNGQIKINGGTPGAGKVLTSDINGLASWGLGTPGPTGAAGPQGPIGLTGTQGIQGAIGPIGPAGSANILGSNNYLIKFNSTTSGTNSQILDDGTNIGIGTATPSSKLEVAGQVKITGGLPGNGKVLTSDLNGLGSWQNIPISTGNIFGFIRLQDFYGNPVLSNLAGISVELTGSSFSATTVSDINGRFEFIGISAGTYSVSATKAGYGNDNIDRISFVGGSIPTFVGSITMSQIPTFNVSTLAAAPSGTNIVISGSINAASANKSTVAIFIGTTASVSSNTSNYIAFKDVSTAVGANTFAFTLTAQMLASIGIPTGSTMYLMAYAINTNNNSASGYTDLVNGRRTYTAVGGIGIPASVIVP